jgi:hypothetical protein
MKHNKVDSIRKDLNPPGISGRINCVFFTALCGYKIKANDPALPARSSLSRHYVTGDCSGFNGLFRKEDPAGFRCQLRGLP